MALLEYIEVGNRFKNAEMLFSAVETISNLNASTSLKLFIHSSNLSLIETVLKADKHSKEQFSINDLKKGHAALEQFIQTQEKGIFEVNTTLNYNQIKDICLKYPNEAIRIQLPKGVEVRLDVKELGIVGFWDDIYKRRKSFEEKLGFIRNEDDL